jgi:ATP-dependent Lon protease
MFMKQASITEVAKKIESAVDESLSNQQKEFFLRQQLAAIQKELQALNSGKPGSLPSASGSELDNDEQAEQDDLAEIKQKIEAMEQGSEVRKAAVREWRRLKRGPPGSAEQGVLRTYVSAFLYSCI